MTFRAMTLHCSYMYTYLALEPEEGGIVNKAKYLTDTYSVLNV